MRRAMPIELLDVQPMNSADRDLAGYCAELGHNARASATLLASAQGALKDQWLRQTATALEGRTEEILAANARDVAAAEERGLSAALVDRLRLTPPRLRAVANSLREVAVLPDPVGHVLDSSMRPNGLQVYKVAVPLGVIFFIYESRPNVTVDAA